MALKRFFSIAVMVILFVSVVGCSSQEIHDLNDSKLIYEETISPIANMLKMKKIS